MVRFSSEYYTSTENQPSRWRDMTQRETTNVGRELIFKAREEEVSEVIIRFPERRMIISKWKWNLSRR